MGIIFDAFKEGEKIISLSEFSVLEFYLSADTDISLAPRFNDLTRDIILTGKINPENIAEPPRMMVDESGEPVVDDDGNEIFELREIDSIRKLANWAIIPEYAECYYDVEVKLTNARGDIVKVDEYENLFVVDYNEKFCDDSGHGKFIVQLREQEIKPLEEPDTD